MHRVDRRAEWAALAGLVLQVVFFAVLLVLFRSNGSAATLAESWHFLAGVGIWFLIFVEVYLHRLSVQQRNEAEELERERLRRIGGSASVFSGLPEGEPLSMEKRLAWTKKWFVPIASLGIAGVLGYLAFRLLPYWVPMAWMQDATETGVRNEQLTMVVLAVITLPCFLVSRYVLGLSRVPGLRVVRAGANYIMGNAIACFVLLVVMAFAYFGAGNAERVLAVAIPAVMAVLGLEILLNLLLNVYRPRIPGEEYQPVYESRFLGLFSEPEGVMRSIAHTIDYQFGFKVSETWFYQLLQQAVVPLVLFGAVMLYLLSCFVIVRPGYQTVVLQFGRIDRVLEEGLYLKWPWPIERTPEFYPVKEVQTIWIGYTGESTWKGEEDKPILWTVKHVTGEEFQLLVASERILEVARERTASQPAESQADAEGSLAPVNILAGALVVNYQIKGGEAGLMEYVENYAEPGQALEAIAYRQWTQYMASVDPMEVMTTGRAAASVALRDAIQKEADGRQLGLKVLQIAVLGLHPSTEIADAYEAAINARHERKATVWRAVGEENAILPRAAAMADEVLSEASADRYGRVIVEQAAAARFNEQLKGYQAAPEVFYLRHYLDVLASATEDVRKFVVTLKDPGKVLLIVDEQEKLPPGLLGLGEEILNERNQ